MCAWHTRLGDGTSLNQSQIKCRKKSTSALALAPCHGWESLSITLPLSLHWLGCFLTLLRRWESSFRLESTRNMSDMHCAYVRREKQQLRRGGRGMTCVSVRRKGIRKWRKRGFSDSIWWMVGLMTTFRLIRIVVHYQRHTTWGRRSQATDR